MPFVSVWFPGELKECAGIPCSHTHRVLFGRNTRFCIPSVISKTAFLAFCSSQFLWAMIVWLLVRMWLPYVPCSNLFFGGKNWPWFLLLVFVGVARKQKFLGWTHHLHLLPSKTVCPEEMFGHHLVAPLIKSPLTYINGNNTVDQNTFLPISNPSLPSLSFSCTVYLFSRIG